MARSRAASFKRSWLNNEHDLHAQNDALWARNERRFFGADRVHGDLPRFTYESATSDHYIARQLAAVYLNFGWDFAEMIAGHLMQKAATPSAGIDFGELGKVGERANPSAPSNRAEAFFYNVDGQGLQGSMWPTFWAQSHMETYPYGHIFQFVEGPDAAPGDQRDELSFGLRPYLRNFTPRQVQDFYISQGVFQYAIIRVPVRSPRVERGRMVGSKASLGYYVLTREGWEGFPDDADFDFAGGGWALFDSAMEFIDGEPWEEALGGEIPMWLYYYQRSKGTFEAPDISRPGVTELAACAVSYMALSSAADFDAIEAASSILYILGADKKVAKEVADQHAAGSRVIGVPRPRSRTDSDVTVFDGSTGAVTADVFEKRLERKMAEARDLMLREATSTPDSSGASKQAGFGERKAPKLANHAAELESAQTNAILWSSKRWGIANPTGSVAMTRDFDLMPLTDRINDYFNLRLKAKIQSPTADVAAFMDYVKEKLAIQDSGVLATIKAEAEAHVATQAENAARQSALDATFGQ